MAIQSKQKSSNNGFSAAENPLLLDLVDISRQFPGVQALDQVNFDLRPGEVHVLFGENGAGKSTLISIVAGALRPHGGEIHFHGEAVNLNSVHHARSLGISAVFQEFSLVPQLTVEQNLFLGAEETSLGMLKKSELREKAKEILDRLGFPIRPSQRVAYLSRAEQQMIEIAKAFRSKLSVLILDEPTASLTDRETEQLFALIEQVKEQGVGIIYITHRMNEIRSIGDRITVLRDGRYVATVDAQTSKEELVHLMTGRVIEQIFPEIQYKPAEPMLEVENLTTANHTVSNVSLHVRRGEVVGLAGLVGSGKSEVARACFGLIPVLSGQVKFAGQDTTGYSPRQMLEQGFYYVPADRRDEGLIMMRSVRENIALPALRTPKISRGVLLRRHEESVRTHDLAKRLNLQPLRMEQDVDHFSGGNQQKVLLAKSLIRDIEMFVFDEPTVGVDVGTRVAIYEFIRDLCQNGASVLLISSDLPEILHLTNRVYIMCRGDLTAELSGDDISQNNVLRHCFEKEAA